MTKSELLEYAKELRLQAAEIEKKAKRKMPRKWKVGQRVRFLHDKDWAWTKGSEATIVGLRDEYKNRKADEYQVFTTSPDSGNFRWWTTPDDVELV